MRGPGPEGEGVTAASVKIKGRKVHTGPTRGLMGYALANGGEGAETVYVVPFPPPELLQFSILEFSNNPSEISCGTGDISPLKVPFNLGFGQGWVHKACPPYITETGDTGRLGRSKL